MKCASCTTDINPAWGHAIESNICPNCGQHIMDEILKSSLATLKLVMADLQPYQTETDDWLLSNHNYIRTDSPDIINYIPVDLADEARRSQEDLRVAQKKADDKSFLERKHKVKYKDENGEEKEFETQQIQDQERTNSFFERAEALLPKDKVSSVSEKTRKIKEMAQKIKRAGIGEVPEEFEVQGTLDYEDAEQLSSISFDSPGLSSGLVSYDDDDIPSSVLQMANRANKNGQGANPKDLETLRRINQKQKDLSEGFSEGGISGGSFKR